ncbi:MAG: hypothetical protein ACYTHK_20115 [Planctomycetota bacterium]|jgi:hypothetical protein
MRPLCLVLLAAACHGPTRLYDGPARPASEVARIEVSGIGGALGRPGDETNEAHIVAINGGEIEQANSVEVLPGRYEVEVWWGWFEVPSTYYGDGAGRGYWVLRDEGRVVLPLQAKPGKRYELDWNIWRRGGPHGFKEVGTPTDTGEAPHDRRKPDPPPPEKPLYAPDATR